LAAARFRVRGLVQGVGFRPFVYRVARDLGLRGWVCNDPAGVLVHAEGTPDALDQLSRLLQAHPPPAAVISSVVRTPKTPVGLADFLVVPSRPGRLQGNALRVPPDRVLCPACRRDTLDPANRRHGYPFTTCTDCGPRFSLLRSLPYDRSTTGMAGYPLCPNCHVEYTDPLNRRFHAETIACPDCGPRASLFKKPVNSAQTVW
jgi:hydrogenase maturation protein HypF